jgi:hypothetical protein
MGEVSISSSIMPSVQLAIYKVLEFALQVFSANDILGTI